MIKLNEGLEGVLDDKLVNEGAGDLAGDHFISFISRCPKYHYIYLREDKNRPLKFRIPKKELSSEEFSILVGKKIKKYYEKS